MPKTIKEVLTDYSGVTSIEYSDGSTRSYTVDNVATISADGQSLMGASGTSSRQYPAIEIRSDALTEPATWTSHVKLFDNAQIGTDSVYWPWIINTSNRIANPLGKYYMYISTDHTTGGVYLLYSNSLTSGWTFYGKVFEDLESGDKGETPSIMWDSTVSKYRMFYHSSYAKWGAGGANSALGGQSTLSATSTNGINWTKDPNFILDIPSANAVRGDGHTGYFLPQQTKNGWVATTLFGSGDGPEWVMWRMGADTSQWTSDYLNLGYSFQWTNGAAFSSFRRNERIHGFIVQSKGVEYLVGMLSNGVSGSTGKIARLFVAPIASNYRELVGAPTVVWAPTESWETDNIRSVTPFVEGGVLYVFYSINKVSVGVFSHVL